MYALLNTNLNYLSDSKFDKKLIYENKKLDRVRVEIQSKREMIKTTPNLYASDYSSEGNADDTEIYSQKKNKTMTSVHKENNSMVDFNPTPRKGELVTCKLKFYKRVIRTLDVLITIISIAGMIISQLENKIYTDINRTKRVLIVHLANCIDKGNCTRSMFNEEEYNKALMTNDYLSTINFTDVDSIHFSLSLDDTCRSIRIALLVLTCITIAGIIASRKIEHVREYYYFQMKNIPFHKTSLFYLMLCEIGLIALIQFPGETQYLFYKEFEEYKIFPITTFLATISLLRVCFIVKLLKSLTRWTDLPTEIICEKYACKANESFAFKAFQKEYSFYVLFIVFALSCLCFGLAMENFEVLYWEQFDKDKTPNYMNWNYTWNAMWFVFVSMTTVGYGDFYPKTQVGRTITIFCCLIGVYFVSSMMVFMTNKTAKNDKEQKAFRLITRIKYKKIIKSHQANVIFLTFKHAILKKKTDQSQFQSQSFVDDDNDNETNDSKAKDTSIKRQFAVIRRKIMGSLKKIKENAKYITICDFSPAKEQLFDLFEMLRSNIKNVKFELNFLETLNLSMKKFTNYQLRCLDNVKKDLYSTKIFYDLVMANRSIFKNFDNLEMPLKAKELLFDNSEMPICNPNKKNNVKLDLISSVEEANESDEDEREFNKSYKYDNNNKKLQFFDFLFENNNNGSTNPKMGKKKTKTLYREAFNKVELRKSEKTCSPIKKKYSKKMSVKKLLS